MFMIREIPSSERPRERFLKYPIDSILNYELIATILRTGSHNESVIDLSKRVVYNYPSLKDLSNASVKDLMKIKGIGKSKAISLLAGFELGRRMNKEKFETGVKLNSPEKIYLYLKSSLEMKTQEHLIGLYLNSKGELIHKKTLFIGSLNSSLVHPREIFKYAVLHSAASMIIAHNHPSGDPTPSMNDIEITKLIHQNGVMMDIILLDHIIIGRDKYYSFKEKELI
jgi:DNA repair protein RadC